MLFQQVLCTGILLLLSLSSSIANEIDIDTFTSQIADSIKRVAGPQYKTLAISRIKKRNGSVSPDIDNLIDYINVKVVRSRRFKVTDRSKLQLILKEQRIQLSEFVSPNEYKELGKILGVQLFIYGTLYNDALVLKAIDVQNSSIIWADIFPLSENSKQHYLLMSLGKQLVESLRRDEDILRKENVRQVSFWNLEVGSFSSEQVMDYLTALASKENLFRFIDRENLQLIYQEQKLNQSEFIDESQARKLGELYGVDAFMYGSIEGNSSGGYVASLKMISIYTGVITWADLIKFDVKEEQMQTAKQKLVNPFELKRRNRQKQKNFHGKMALIPGGKFVMGSNDPLYQSNPENHIHVDPFMLDLHEVSNAEYKSFVEKANHRLPTSWKHGNYPQHAKDFPVVGIGWDDARLYCLSQKKRLPTEAEWERAARGVHGRKYTWKNPNFVAGYATTLESGATQSVPVYTQTRDITPEGVKHMIGNVREFVQDRYRPYTSSQEPSNTSRDRVIRGSSWAFGSYEAAGFFRGHSRPNLAWPDVGFRCAKTP